MNWLESLDHLINQPWLSAKNCNKKYFTSRKMGEKLRLILFYSIIFHDWRVLRKRFSITFVHWTQNRSIFILETTDTSASKPEMAALRWWRCLICHYSNSQVIKESFSYCLIASAKCLAGQKSINKIVSKYGDLHFVRPPKNHYEAINWASNGEKVSSDDLRG